jgi:hypothetical protein
MIEGTCLCGALQYEVTGPVLNLVHCHCSMCRKHHGAPFATWAVVPEKALRWLHGQSTLSGYPSSPERVRHFCGTCSSVAPTLVGDRVLVPAGNLFGELGVVGGFHMFVGSKAPWHTIGDRLPQHDSLPPGWPTQEVFRPADTERKGTVHGSCLCGEVTFSVVGKPTPWLQCHCSRCRRGRSAVHGSNAFYPTDQFTWLSGKERVRAFRPSDAERFTVAFCANCGGATPVERDAIPFIMVPASLFDVDPGARPQAHIHVSSKAPWYAFEDGLPQFAGLPPA